MLGIGLERGSLGSVECLVRGEWLRLAQILGCLLDGSLRLEYTLEIELSLGCFGRFKVGANLFVPILGDSVVFTVRSHKGSIRLFVRHEICRVLHYLLGLASVRRGREGHRRGQVKLLIRLLIVCSRGGLRQHRRVWLLLTAHHHAYLVFFGHPAD